MVALASLAQLEARLGRALTDPTEQARALALLDDASAAVRNYTAQTISEATTTDRLSARNGWVNLPQRPATAVDAVVDDNANVVSWRWATGSQEICLDSPQCVTWSYSKTCDERVYVTVTYTHGYTTIPDDIVAVVCNVAGRSLGVQPESAAVTQQSITNFSESFGPVGAAGPVGLFTHETTMLDRYRRVGTTAWVGA